MIAEVCGFYKWTDSHVLEMPASRFFVMLHAARKIKRIDRVQDCYVARCASMPSDDFIETIRWFNNYEKEVITNYSHKESEKGLSGEAARVAVMAAFAKDRNINHEVRH